MILDFSPSSSNYVELLIAQDQDENGYFIRIGGSDDEVSLFKSPNGQPSKIIDGLDGYVDSSFVQLSVQVIRDSLRNWQVYTSRYESGLLLQGEVHDNTHLFPQVFGIKCVFTSSRSNKFFYDNIEVSGKAFLDTFPIPLKNDVIINEIIFNPLDGEVDFVEIINRSNKNLNIKDLQIGNYYARVPDNFKSITKEYFFMAPQEILVLCNSKSKLLQYLPNTEPSKVLELESMPAYNNDQGTSVILLDSVIIDEFSYSEEPHFELLAEVKSVSLERINTEIPTSQNSNWHSASEASYFATSLTNKFSGSN